MAGGGGKLCVVCCGNGIVVVDVVASPKELWVLDTPMGFKVLKYHY